MAFANITESELQILDDAKDSQSTKKVVKRSVKLFRTFLGQENSDFEQMPKYVLNNNLRLFFASIRNEKGDELKKSSMMTVKYGISKYIKEKRKIDISVDEEFSSSMRTFKAKLTDLQKKGKGSVDHKPEITDLDLQKLRDPTSIAFNQDTPYGLQNKVWFDLMFHLCRRGRENLRQMTKSTFAVEVDSAGREYIRQVIDEADKNHGAESTPDDTTGEARMYAQPGNTMCPVQSFKKYLNKLHTELDALWQKPRDSFFQCEAIWYCKSPLGKNVLGVMMSKISVSAGLSKKYTNHCIRATSIAALDKAGFEARHIIRATGHKSENSIKSYSSRLSEGTKRKMSDALSGALVQCEDAPTVRNTQSDQTSHLKGKDLDRISTAECYVSESLKTVTTKETNVAQIIPGSPQIINFPGTSQHGYNIAPDMNNCNVQFHFHGK